MNYSKIFNDILSFVKKIFFYFIINFYFQTNLKYIHYISNHIMIHDCDSKFRPFALFMQKKIKNAICNKITNNSHDKITKTINIFFI